MLKFLIKKLKIHRNPIAYWRSQGVKIGDGCEIYSTVNFGSEPYLITIGNNVRLVDGVRFITHDGAVWVLRNIKEEYKDCDIFAPITVKDNVHIGMSAIIMPGVTIGSNCIIGCGAVVTRDIPDNSIAVGVPAKVIKTLNEYEETNATLCVHTKGMSREEKRKILEEYYMK